MDEKAKKRYIKLRNAKIVVSWARRGASYEDLAKKYNLTERRIQQIVYDNADFVKINKEKERCRRANILNRLIQKKQETTNRDIVDLLDAQRKEIEGDAGGGSSKETKIIIIRSGGDVPAAQGDNGRADNHAQTVSRSLSI
jgi:hypothetical protein